VTGLPVSDHDHGVNGLEFDDYGNLYIQVGGNTNAGVEGALSQTRLQKENYLSAATLIARDVRNPNFDGFVTYDIDGNMISGFDVEVFAAGLRNPFDLVFHSNGKLYGTDNGPNLKFGERSLNCTHNGPGKLLFTVQSTHRFSTALKIFIFIVEIQNHNIKTSWSFSSRENTMDTRIEREGKLTQGSVYGETSMRQLKDTLDLYESSSRAPTGFASFRLVISVERFVVS
jgi:hypothetical protein